MAERRHSNDEPLPLYEPAEPEENRPHSHTSDDPPPPAYSFTSSRSSRTSSSSQEEPNNRPATVRTSQDPTERPPSSDRSSPPAYSFTSAEGAAEPSSPQHQPGTLLRPAPSSPPIGQRTTSPPLPLSEERISRPRPAQLSLWTPPEPQQPVEAIQPLTSRHRQQSPRPVRKPGPFGRGCLRCCCCCFCMAAAAGIAYLFTWIIVR
jgi:hypothetical protein